MESDPAVRIKSKLEHNLTTYVAAASATAGAMLAASMPSKAEVIYTPAHQVIRPTLSYNLDVNQDGTTDFIIKDRFHRTCTDLCSGTSVRLFLKPAKGNGAAGASGNHFAPASALDSGRHINRHQYFVGTLMALVYRFFGTIRSTGNWINVQDRYLGLRFKINGKNHFGWARLDVSVQLFNVTATLTGYAYETVPHKPIVAGNRGRSIGGRGPDVPIAPSSLGSLALGTAGRNKHRHSQVAVTDPR